MVWDGHPTASMSSDSMTRTSEQKDREPMKTPRHWLIAAVIGLGSLSARAMEQSATMQIGVVGTEGDYHIKLHGAPAHAPVTLVVDGRPFTPVTFPADSFGRLDLSLSSILSSMRD